MQCIYERVDDAPFEDTIQGFVWGQPATINRGIDLVTTKFLRDIPEEICTKIHYAITNSEFGKTPDGRILLSEIGIFAREIFATEMPALLEVYLNDQPGHYALGLAVMSWCTVTNPNWTYQFWGTLAAKDRKPLALTHVRVLSGWHDMIQTMA